MKTSRLNSRTFQPWHTSAQLCFLAAGLMLSGAFSQAATTYTWTLNGSGFWSSTANWSGGLVGDGAGNTASFSTLNITGNRTVSLDSARTIDTIQFGDTSGGQTWTLTPTNASTCVLTMDNTGGTSGTLPRVRVLQNTATINVVLAGTAGLRTPDQVGTVVLNAANTYTGDTLLYRGTCRIGNAAALPSGSRTGNVNFINLGSGDCTLDLNNRNMTINGLASVSPGLGTVTSATAGAITLTVGDNNATATFDGVIQNGSGNVGLTKIGAGEQVLTGVNTYSGATTVNNGRLTGKTGGSCANSAVTVTSSGTLGVQYAGSDGTWTASSLTVNGGGLRFDLGANAPSIVAAPLTLNAGLTFGATPTVVIVNAGATALANGTYPLIKYTTTLAGAGNLPDTVTLPDGGIGTLQDNTGTQTLDLIVGGALPPTIHWATGNGVWDTSTTNWKDLSGNSTNYADAVGVPVRFTDADATGNPFVTNNASLQPGSVGVSASSHNYTLTGSGSIDGAASVSKSGSGVLTMDLTNNYTGGTILAAGTLNLKNASALGSSAGTLTLVGGTLDNTSGSPMTLGDYPQAWLGDFTFAGTGDLNLGAGAVTVSGSRTLTVNAGTLTVNGNIAGTGAGLAKAGAGTLALNAGLNTSSGGTLTVNAGTVRLGVGNLIFLFNGDTRLVGGTLVLTDTNALLNSALNLATGDTGTLSFGTLTNPVLGSLKGSRNLLLENDSSAAVELQVGNKNNTGDNYIGTLSGAGSLTKIGTGTWQLGAGGLGVNTYAGDTHIVSGKLAAGATDIFPHGAGKGNMVIESGATFDFQDRSLITLNGLLGSGIVDSSDKGGNPGLTTLKVGDADTTASFGGVIQNVAAPTKTAGTVTLVKIGAGTQTLSGVNTYSGTTTVSNGTLRVSSPGSLPNTAVTVRSGATLSGDGTVNGPVIVDAGGNLAPGNSPGTLMLGNGLNLSGGGKYVWELAANSDSNPGVDFDQIALTGALTLGGSSVLSLQFVGTATAPNSSVAFWQVPHSWTVIAGSGFASNFSAVENGTYAAGTFSTSVQAGGIVLTFSPPPLTITSIAGVGTASVTVNYTNTVATHNYTLQYNTNLSTVNWYDAGTKTASGTSDFQTDTPPLNETNRFYRIKTP